MSNDTVCSYCKNIHDPRLACPEFRAAVGADKLLRNLSACLNNKDRLAKLTPLQLIREALASEAADFDVTIELMNRLRPGWEKLSELEIETATAPTCTPTEGEKYIPTADDREATATFVREKMAEKGQPTHSAQESAERTARELMALYEERPSDPVYFHLHRWNEKELASIILRHFPSTPTQSDKCVHGIALSGCDEIECRKRALREATPSQSQQPPLSPGSGEVTGETSDGYHTFNELYDHRCTLFLALMKAHPVLSWISTKHADGSTFGDWFIAGMRLPTGDVSYHLPARMWSLACETGAKILDYGLAWDGHTSADVVKRIQAFLAQPANPPLTSGEDFDQVTEWLDLIEVGLVAAADLPNDTGSEANSGLEAVQSLRRHLEKLSAPPLPSIGDGKDGELEAALNMACSTIREARLHIAGRGVLPEGEVIKLLEEAEQNYRSKLTK